MPSLKNVHYWLASSKTRRHIFSTILNISAYLIFAAVYEHEVNPLRGIIGAFDRNLNADVTSGY
jgi:hypothetical protein